jgi:hypothetical protein
MTRTVFQKLLPPREEKELEPSGEVLVTSEIHSVAGDF